MKFKIYFDVKTSLMVSDVEMGSTVSPKTVAMDVIDMRTLLLSWKVEVCHDTQGCSKWTKYSLDDLCHLEKVTGVNMLPRNYRDGPVWVNFETAPFVDPKRWGTLTSEQFISKFT